jgi:hypothetical protein
MNGIMEPPRQGGAALSEWLEVEEAPLALCRNFQRATFQLFLSENFLTF